MSAKPVNSVKRLVKKNPENISPEVIPEVLRELSKNEPASLDKLTNRRGTKYEKKSEKSRKEQQSGASRFQRGGYDTVEIGYLGHWKDFSALKQELENALAAIKEKDVGAQYVRIGNRECLLRPKMAKTGPKYFFVLELNGVKIYIPRTYSTKPNALQIQLRYGGVALTGHDFFHLHVEVMKTIHEFGFVPVKEILQRVDLQVMLPENTESTLELILNCCFACKAKDDDFYRKNRILISYWIGKNTKLRIYDKVAEMKANPDRIAKSFLTQHCIGDWLKSKKPITRFEFQLRKDSLRRLGICNVNDLLAGEPGLIEYLVDWFRLLKSPKKNGSNGKEHPIWLEVIRLFRMYFPGIEGMRKSVKWERRKGGACHDQVLNDGLTGYLSSIVSQRFGEQPDKDALKAVVDEIVESNLQRIHEKTNEKAKQRQVGKGVTIGDHEAEKQE